MHDNDIIAAEPFPGAACLFECVRGGVSWCEGGDMLAIPLLIAINSCMAVVWHFFFYSSRVTSLIPIELQGKYIQNN